MILDFEFSDTVFEVEHEHTRALCIGGERLI